MGMSDRTDRNCTSCGQPHTKLPAWKTQLISRTSVLLPLVFTDSTPPSRPAGEAYIWLVPITWLLPAFRLKYIRPSAAVLRSYRLSMPEFFCTAAIPFFAELRDLYCSLRSITSLFPALRTN